MAHAFRLAALLAVLAAPTVMSAQDSGALVKQGQKLLQSGDLAGARAKLEAAVKADPDSYDAHFGLGRVLDLAGRYQEARSHFERALDLAPEDGHEQPIAAIAVSYAFERKADEAARYYQRTFDKQTSAGDFDGAGATANAIARVYLESGNVAKAEEWYRTGHETARQTPQMRPEQVELAEFRWQHAQARLAVRRGDVTGARRAMQQARAVLARGNIEDQQIQWPYLAGYVAFYSGDYAAAVKELATADQRDPFILGLVAQAYDRMGEKGRTAEYCRKVLATTSHGINAAFSRPFCAGRPGL